MDEVPVRQLNQDTAGVLARVKSGEQIAITERGRVIAHLNPVAMGPLADLVARGTVRPPTVHTHLPAPRGPVRNDRESGTLLEQMRDDERF